MCFPLQSINDSLQSKVDCDSKASDDLRKQSVVLSKQVKVNSLNYLHHLNNFIFAASIEPKYIYMYVYTTLDIFTMLSLGQVRAAAIISAGVVGSP